jgi:hypothetical protein
MLRRKNAALASEVRRILAEHTPLTVDQITDEITRRRHATSDWIVLSRASLRRKQRLRHTVERLVASENLAGVVTASTLAPPARTGPARFSSPGLRIRPLRRPRRGRQFVWTALALVIGLALAATILSLWSQLWQPSR